MSRRSREESAPAAAANDTAAMIARWATPAQVDTLRQLCLAGTIGLYVATALIPSEGVAREGTGLILVMLWILLGGTWIVEGLLRGRLEVRASMTGTAMIALVGWHAVSAFAMGGQGNARYAANMLWEWIGLGTGFLLLRSLVASEKQVRAVVAVMVGLAVMLSIYSFYQYYVIMPEQRREFEENPQQVMLEAGSYAEPGTPAYEHFRNRLFSPEPTSTFALTNSLADVLAAWLVVALGVLLLAWQDKSPNRSALAGMGLCLLPIIFSLLLTQSKTAYVAAALGVAIVWVYGRNIVSRQMWIVPVAAVGLVALMGLAAYFSGGIPSDAVQNVPGAKSLLYRLEYWQATASLIDKQPFFGTGPGNFQDYYTSVQLPQSSETVSDPHNFLLEIWATAGSPALFALLAVLGCFAYEASRGAASQDVELDVEDAIREKKELEALAEAALRRDLGDPVPEPEPSKPAKPDELDKREPGVNFIYGGALAGAILSLPLGALAGLRSMGGPEGLEFDFGLYLIALPLAALGVFLLHQWVEKGKLPISVLASGVAVMLIALLASGGINFPGVAGSLWILIGLTLYLCERHKPAYVLPPPVAMMGVVLAIGLVILCHQTAFLPVLSSKDNIAAGFEALQLGRYDEAEASFQAAAKADSFSPDPPLHLATLYHRRWLASSADFRSPELFQKFVAAKDRTLKLNQHSHITAETVGRWYLEAYRSTGDEAHLTESINAYKRAATLFPNSSILHAQLAWVHHLAKDQQSAANEAAEAIRLDKLNGHQERALANQSLYDPGPAGLRTGMLPGPGARKAAKVIDEELYGFR